MKELNYAYCVARLRANESKMLSDKEIIRLSECKNYDEALGILVNSGWTDVKGSVKEIIDGSYKSLWSLLNESAPDKKELEVLCVLNDYFNIKTAVKCDLSGLDPFDYYIEPTSLNLSLLTQRVNNHSFDFGSKSENSVSEEAYKIAHLTENGQNAEIVIDRAAINCLYDYWSEKNHFGLIKEVCAFLCDTANIKTALRINSLKKSKDFAEKSIGKCCEFNRDELIRLSLGERNGLMEFLSKSKYSEGVELYVNSSALFEKWCDTSILKLISKAKFTAFGFDPVCAFYYSKINEIKNVRVILSALQAGIDSSEIKERLRVDYV